jgi:hypothetical protein
MPTIATDSSSLGSDEARPSAREIRDDIRAALDGQTFVKGFLARSEESNLFRHAACLDDLVACLLGHLQNAKPVTMAERPPLDHLGVKSKVDFFLVRDLEGGSFLVLGYFKARNGTPAAARWKWTLFLADKPGSFLVFRDKNGRPERWNAGLHAIDEHCSVEMEGEVLSATYRRALAAIGVEAEA